MLPVSFNGLKRMFLFNFSITSATVVALLETSIGYVRQEQNGRAKLLTFFLAWTAIAVTILQSQLEQAGSLICT